MNTAYIKLLIRSKDYTSIERDAIFDYQFTGYKLINRLTHLIYRENAFNVLKSDENQFNLINQLYHRLKNVETLFERLKFNSLESFVSSGLKEAEIIDNMKHHYNLEDEIILSRVRVHSKVTEKQIQPIGSSNFISTTTKNKDIIPLALDLYNEANLPTKDIYLECYKVKDGTPAIAVIPNPKVCRIIGQCLEDEILLFKDAIKYREDGKQTFEINGTYYYAKYYEIEPNNNL